MADKVKIDVVAFEMEIERLSRAIEEFRPYSKKFMNETSDKIDKFNSDFITEIQRTLRFMEDTKAPELLAKLERVEELSRLVLEEFVKVDDEIATKNKGWF